MKPSNLLVLAQGFRSVPPTLLAAFEAQLSERDEPLGEVKEHEAASVVALVDELCALGATHPMLYEGFVYSFSIPQISSEFDLLKLTRTCVVNVELKSEDVGSARLRRQLVRNRSYLAPLQRTISTFSYVQGTRTLFELRDDGSFGRCGFERLAEVLRSAEPAYDGVVEDLFRAANYLVSPLNNPHRFLEGAYFLTNHQEQIRASFLTACESFAQAGRMGEPPVFLVYGSAGTGKTLLLYDLARSLPQEQLGNGRDSRVCVIHCGLLCAGHEELARGQQSFAVLSAKHSERVSLAAYSAVFVDEAQRMWPSQIEHVVHEAYASRLPLYLSLDRRQVLSRGEQDRDVQEHVRAAFSGPRVWELSRKIRTNRELVDFIRALFGLRGAPRRVRTGHVKLCCAEDEESARTVVGALRNEGYQYLVMDGPSVAGCPTPGEVIGQEFDKVVMAAGASVSLDFSGGSVGHADDFRHRQLLYQGLTRARNEIALVVYNNDALLESLFSILG